MPYRNDPDMVTTTIRLPRALLERIDNQAKEDRRSRNAMVTVIIEQWFESP